MQLEYIPASYKLPEQLNLKNCPGKLNLHKYSNFSNWIYATTFLHKFTADENLPTLNKKVV
jgi:hypothetical protein